MNKRQKKKRIKQFLKWCDEHVNVIGSDHYVYVGHCTITKEQKRNIFLDESIDETAGYGEEQEHE